MGNIHLTMELVKHLAPIGRAERGMRLAKAKAARGADMAASMGVNVSWVTKIRGTSQAPLGSRLKASLLGRLRIRKVQVSWRNVIGFWWELRSHAGFVPVHVCIRVLTSIQAAVSCEELMQSLFP